MHKIEFLYNQIVNYSTLPAYTKARNFISPRFFDLHDSLQECGSCVLVKINICPQPRSIYENPIFNNHCVSGLADEKELNKDQVPKAVIDAFEKDYPNAKPEFEQETFEGKTAYELEYKENGKEVALLYGDDGTLLQKEEEIDGKSLPKPIAQAVNKAHPKAKIKEVEKLMKPDGTLTGYEVEIKTGGKEVELHLDTNGKILKTVKE